MLGSRLRGRHALFPPKGEEKEEVKPARHATAKTTSLVELEPGPGAAALDAQRFETRSFEVMELDRVLNLVGEPPDLTPS